MSADTANARVRAITSAHEVIATAVAEACGSPLASKRRITEGYSNEVYGASTTHGQEVIVRIHWWSAAPHFQAERWALTRAVSE